MQLRKETHQQPAKYQSSVMTKGHKGTYNKPIINSKQLYDHLCSQVSERQLRISRKMK
jgi:hypothetical protein